MLVDEVTLRLVAGAGGRGAVAFNKVKMMQGPTGGNGGRGANVYFEGVADINALMPFASRKLIEANNGENARGQFVDGSDGKDLVLKIPTGTTITNVASGYKQEMLRIGQRILAAGGGMGGKGNFNYRSSTNTSPKQFQEGLAGDEVTFLLELKLIADVGLVGLPNAGKSSLLNELTAAKSKVANYPFTTLEPSLGAYYELIIADIPGLIEGAAAGKGLGVKFLKHVERTDVLFHLISAETDNALRDYRVIRTELGSYNKALLEKREFVFISKADLSADPSQIVKTLAKHGIRAITLSLLDPASIQKVREILNGLKDEKME